MYRALSSWCFRNGAQRNTFVKIFCAGLLAAFILMVLAAGRRSRRGADYT